MGPDPDTTLPPVGAGTGSYHPGGPDPPRAFGEYELLAEIARGGMGLVYRARQTALNRTVALKMILAGELAGPDDVRRFRAEAAAAAALDHPNVLPVYEVGERFGQHFFAMKLVEGGSLAGRIPDLVRDPSAAVALVAAVARAVAYAHGRGVVHRDLKPANVLLGSDGTPYVADFGLAKRDGADDRLTRTGAILGTPSYMAPEQARGEKGVGPAADVYALGAILYECLTGRPPFQGPTALDTVLEVLDKDPPHPRAVNPAADRALSRVALKCLEKDPAARYPSAAALADDLDRWAAGEAVLAARQSMTRRVLSWARREPGLACRLAMLGLCAVVVHLKYRLDPAVGVVHHFQIMAILGAWAAASTVCQLLLRRDRYAIVVVAAWLAADAVFLTGLLTLDESHETPLVLTYGLFVAASGVWLRVRLVWFATAASVAGYAVLVGLAAARGAVAGAPHHHAIAVFALVTTGAVVAYQVRRARLLGEFRGPPAAGRPPA